MSRFAIRPFRRSDREQVARLVSVHAAAVMPGASVSVNAVLSQFEREPREFIVDPWVSEREVLVAEQESAVVAAALLVRYRSDSDVGESFRNAAAIQWLLFWPYAPKDNQHWTDRHAAAVALMRECIDRFDRWGATTRFGDASLPVPFVYGMPEQWPHIERLFVDAGFEQTGAGESLYVLDLNRASLIEPPRRGLSSLRSLGMNGTRITASLDGEPVGYIEVDIEPAERGQRRVDIADVGNLVVAEMHRRQGIASWLLWEAVQWLRLARIDRLVYYTWPEETDQIAFVESAGFVRVTTTKRGWKLTNR